jgi:hypothetical protein
MAELANDIHGIRGSPTPGTRNIDTQPSDAGGSQREFLASKSTSFHLARLTSYSTGNT